MAYPVRCQLSILCPLAVPQRLRMIPTTPTFRKNIAWVRLFWNDVVEEPHSNDSLLFPNNVKEDIMRIFNNSQLEQIEILARQAAERGLGELAVSSLAGAKQLGSTGTIFSAQELGIIQFCAEECRRQGSGELSVFWMVNAYNHAATNWSPDSPLTTDDVEELLTLIEPGKNANGFRCTTVRFRSGQVLDVGIREIRAHLRRQLGLLLEAKGEGNITDPVDFYREFEKIHPANDGNGRAGAILFNFYRGSLLCPVAAPDLFGCHHV